MRSGLFVIGAICALAGAAQGGLFFESEPNSTPPQADDLGSFSIGDTEIVLGEIEDGGGDDVPGDVDWYSLTLTEDTVLLAAVFCNDSDADGTMQLLSGDGSTIIAFDDDEGIGLMPSFQVPLSAGFYYIGISGYPDGVLNTVLNGFDDFNQAAFGHGEEFAYKLLIGLNVPTTGTTGALALAGMIALRRRR